MQIAPARKHWTTAAMAFAMLGAMGLVSLSAAHVSAASPGQPVQGTAGSGPAQKHAKTVLLWFRGISFTVEELTGVPYQRGLALAKRICRRWGTPPAGVMILGYAPTINAPHWRVPARQRARAIYRHELEGVLQAFLLRKVQASLQRKFKPDISPYVRLSQVRLAISRDARADSIGSHVFRKILALHLDATASLRVYTRTFPSAHIGPADWRRYWRMEQSNANIFFICAECFPTWLPKGGGAAPWYRDQAMTALTRYQLGVIIARNPAKFIAMANRLYGWNLFISLRGAGASRSVRAAFGNLADALSRPSGAIARRGFIEANATLRQLASTAGIGLGRGTGTYFKRVYGIAPRAIRQRTVLVGRRPGGRSVLLYLPMASPQRLFKGRHTGPGTFAYDLAISGIAGPIVDRVVRGAMPGRGFKLPSRRWLLRNISDGWIDRPGTKKSQRVFSGKTPWVPLPIPK